MGVNSDRITNGVCLFFEKLGALNARIPFTLKSFHTVNIQESPEDELCQTWTLYWIYKIFIEGVPPRGETATAEVAEQAVKEVEAKCADPNAKRVECGWAGKWHEFPIIEPQAVKKPFFIFTLLIFYYLNRKISALFINVVSVYGFVEVRWASLTRGGFGEWWWS